MSPAVVFREIRHIARAVYTAGFSHGQKVGVNPIFVSRDQEEDPRVEVFRLALHCHYDGVVMSTEFPPPPQGASGERSLWVRVHPPDT